MAFDKHYPLWMQAKPSGGGTDAPPGVGDALVASISAATGGEVAFVDAPTVGDSSFGPGSIVFSLRSDELPTEWMGRLVAFPVGTESAVLRRADALPCKVATLVTDTLAVSDDLGGTLAVASVPAGRDFVDLIGEEPETATPRLKQMASVHAQLHRVTSSGFDGVEPLDFDASISALPDSLASEAAWLSGNHPGSGAQVLCHGGLSPLMVRQDTEDPNALVFRNWSGAVVAEPEFDLAWTLLSFWLAPMFAATRSERRGMLMIRDGLANLYQSGYKAVAPIDTARVKYWQAYHCAIGHADDLRNPGAFPSEVGPSLKKRFAKLTR